MQSMADVTAPPQPNPLREFLRIPWANVLYLGSAACILTGVGMVIVPIYDKKDLALEKFGVLGALNGYEFALLAVTLTLLIWRNITRDAVALAVLMSAFLVGSAAALDTVAPGYAWPAVWLGLGGLLAAIAKGRLVGKYAIGRFTPIQLAGLTLALAWNFLAPGALGLILDNAGVDAQLRPAWLLGWWVMLLAFAAMTVETVLAPRGAAAPPPDQPFLRGPLMRWIVIGIILACTLLHQWALTWSFGLPFKAGDLWLGVALLGVLACEVLRNTGARSWLFDMSVMGTVFTLACVAVRNNACSEGLSWSLGVVCHVPLAMIAAGVLIEALAWLGGRHWLHLAALAHAVIGAVTITSNLEITINRGWLLIGASFILLAIGAAVSVTTQRLRELRVVRE